MPQSPSYYFLTPDVKRPVGGVAVIYAFVDILREAGYEAFVLQQSPRHVYGFSDVSASVRYSLGARDAWLRHVPLRRRLAARLKSWRVAFRREEVRKADLRAGDYVIVPEYYLDLLPDLFPGQVKVLLSQNNFTHLAAYVRAAQRGVTAIGAATAQIATSRICHETVSRLGAASAHYVPLHIDAGLFAYRQEKRRQIAFMPRKNAPDVRVVTTLLRERGRIGDYELVAMENMGRDTVAQTMGDALFFLAFSEREGFGLPPAEAMASGCVVIGYRGHGGDEFFDEATGVPVRAGDLLGFVEAIEAAVAEYDTDPSRLDELRRHASARICETYSFEAMRDGLLSVWRTIHQEEGGAPAPAG